MESYPLMLPSFIIREKGKILHKKNTKAKNDSHEMFAFDNYTVLAFDSSKGWCIYVWQKLFFNQPHSDNLSLYDDNYVSLEILVPDKWIVYFDGGFGDGDKIVKKKDNFLSIVITNNKELPWA